MEHRARWHGCDIYLHAGDITTLDVDAIVNAANPWLMGGGGVDGAIHRRGGPAILAECREILRQRGGTLPTGEAVATTGGRLKARYVVHTVGPVFHEHSTAAAEQLLASCYRMSLAAARAQGTRSVAFPCISTGAYGYPPAEACPIALRAIQDDLGEHGGIDQVVFCTYEPDDYELYACAFDNPPPGVTG